MPLTHRPDQESPAGSLPVSLQSYGAFPPVAAGQNWYAEPTFASGSLGARIENPVPLTGPLALALPVAAPEDATLGGVPCAFTLLLRYVGSAALPATYATTSCPM